jgi:hypothetical protein
MLVSEAIQTIQSLYSRGVQSQDSRLMPRHIWNKLLRTRSKLLAQQSNKNQSISQWTYQTIPCVELIQAAPYECPCVPAAGCSLLRSRYPIPEPITSLKGNLIQSVSSLDGSLIIDSTSFATAKYAEGNKFTSKKPQYLFYNNYLFITISKVLKVVQVTELAENPEDVWNFPSFCEDECTDCCLSPLDRQFPLDNDLIDTAVQLTVNELISIFTQMREDRFNNSTDDTANSNIVHNPNQVQ